MNIKTRISNVKSTITDNKPEFISLAIASAASLTAAAVAVYAVHKFATDPDAVVIPAYVVEHLKKTDGGIVALDVVGGFDIYVKLIPVKS